ncbi:eukaryotic translation initiation factor 3 subunit I (EIF3I) [Vairimorpha necatrix]|uniref:Serine-threonine kinase receptor-associated protein n=1 Tax=Vairimorpha necatrix TaxID=6039 RepID=A0AAX4JEC0_9MICR
MSSECKMSSESSNGRQIKVKCHERPITDLKFNKDGDLIFTSSKDSTCNVLYTDGTPLGSFSGHDGSIFSFSLSDNSQFLLTGSADQSVVQWDIEKGLKINQEQIKSVIKATDNFKNENLFIIGCDGSMGKDKCILLYDCRSKESNKLISLDTNPTGILIDYSQNNVLISNDDGSICQLDLRNNLIINKAQVHTSKITKIKPSACRTFLVSSSIDSQAKIVDMANLNTIKTFVCEEPINCSVIFGTNDKIICVGGINARDVTQSKGKNKFDTKFFDVVTTEQIGFYTTHYGTINCVDVNTDGTMYCSGGETGLLSVVNFGEDFYNSGFTNFNKF